jgi:hypothetical protein
MVIRHANASITMDKYVQAVTLGRTVRNPNRSQVRPGRRDAPNPFQCPKMDRWRYIAITLIDPDFGEQTAQACANA